MLCQRLETPPNTGFSFDDDEARSAWVEILSAIRRHIHDNGMFEDVLFHGTSEHALQSLQQEGLAPGLVNHALMGERRALSLGYPEYGSFWGTVDMAAHFAEDTASVRHPGSRPVILAISRQALEADCELLPDVAMADDPADGLTMMDDPETAAEWYSVDCENGWRSSLHDLGAVVAIHDFTLPREMLTVIQSFDDYLILAGATRVPTDIPRA